MSRRHANLLLIDASLLWGFGNVAQKTELVHLDPFSAVGLRCLIGGILVLPLV
ncbi:EamA family transporter [Rhodobacter ferrooxidans]|uniref:EamA family transporter n=1 Tax=Rhodobacter ferrooxidans TaxID=371731 RepID=UPI00373AF0DC